MIVLDRFEGDRAVLELDGQLIEVPRALLPAGAREGDVLRLIVDEGSTQDRKAEAESRLQRLRARTPQGPGSFDL